MAGTGAEKHAPPIANFEEIQLHLASPPTQLELFRRVVSTVSGVSSRRRTDVGDFAPIVRRSYSDRRSRLVLWFSKRTFARPVNLKSPAFKRAHSIS